MFRAVAFATALFVSIASLRAQDAVPPPAGVIPPPAAPSLPAGTPVLPVPPPLPGQLQAQPSSPPPVVTPPTVGAPAMPVAGETKTVPAVPLAKPKPGSSTSSTGQFIIHGDDLTIRSALSSKCEDIAKDLRELLKDKQPWVLPVVVLVTSGEAARKADKPASTTISQLAHGGFHIQVNVNMRPDLRPEDLRKELVRALLAERILRDQKEIATKRSLLLPDWLFLGILEAGEYRQRARPSALFAAIFKSGKIFGIEDIIEAPASAIEDALSRTIYQTSCCALVLALLDQPDGGLRMGKFLNALATDPRSERELLNQWFPNFAASDASLNKWWALQLATLASPGVSEPLSPEDTLAALEDALILRFQAKPSELPQTSRHTPVVRKPEPAAPAPAPTPVALSTTREAKSEEKPADPAPVMEAPPEEKRGFFGRLNPFAKPKSSDEAITDAIEAAAKAEAESAMPPAAQEESLPPVGSDLPPETPVATKKEPAPLLNRWFGEGKKEAATPTPEAEEKVKPQPKPEPKAPAKPAAAAKPTPAPEPTPSEPEADKKPSNLNPMNWFRGGKKEKEKEKEAPPADASAHDTAEAPDQAVALSQESPSIEAQLRAGTPLIAMVYQEVAVEAEEKASEKKRFFGLFGKKKPESDPAEPEAPKKPESEPKAEPKKTKEAPAPAPAPAAPAPPAPAEEAMPAPEKEGETEAKPEKNKRSFLGLHLFGGDKKESTDEASPEEAAAATMPVAIPNAIDTAPRPKPKPAPAPAPKSAPKNESTVAAGIPIEDYAAVIKRKDFSTIIRHNVNALGALQTRAAVLFRPIVSDYIQVLEDLNDGKTKGMDARLKTLRARTREALTKSNAIRDLLDLHEANDTPAMSGLFEDYLKLPETIQNELPERNDAISKYLDALDKEFSKK